MAPWLRPGRNNLFPHIERPSSEEALLFGAHRVRAFRAAQLHLPTRPALVPRLRPLVATRRLGPVSAEGRKVGGHDVRQSMDKRRFVVQALKTVQIHAVLSSCQFQSSGRTNE